MGGWNHITQPYILVVYGLSDATVIFLQLVLGNWANLQLQVSVAIENQLHKTVAKCYFSSSVFHWPSSQGAPHMVKQKYNSSYGITKLLVDNSCTYRVPLWWFRTYSTLVQTSTATCLVSCMVRAPTATSSKNEIWSDSQNFNICTES